MVKKSLLLVLCIIGSISLFAQITNYPWPALASLKSDKYTIRVREIAANGTASAWITPFAFLSMPRDYDVYKHGFAASEFVNGEHNRVGGTAASSFLQDRNMTFSMFAFAGKIEVEVTKDFGTAASRVNIAPKGYGFEPHFFDGKTVRFYMDRPEYVSVDFVSADNRDDDRFGGDDIKYSVMIFADKPESEAGYVIPKTTDPGVVVYNDNVDLATLRAASIIYFPAGEHNLKNHKDNDMSWYYSTAEYNAAMLYHGKLNLGKDGQKVYLAPGAYVSGAFHSNGKKNNWMYGRGIVSGRNHLMHEIIDPVSGTNGIEYIQTTQSKEAFCAFGDDAVYNGIMFLEAYHHTCPSGKSTTINDIKIIGWSSNNDGIRPGANSTIDHIFIKTSDDYDYARDKHTVTNSVFWPGVNGAVGQLGWNNLGVGYAEYKNNYIINCEWSDANKGNVGVLNGSMSDAGIKLELNKLENIYLEGTVNYLVNCAVSSGTAVGYYRDFTFKNIIVEKPFQNTNGTLVKQKMQGIGGTVLENWTFTNLIVNGELITQNNYKTYFDLNLDAQNNDDAKLCKNIIFNSTGTFYTVTCTVGAGGSVSPSGVGGVIQSIAGTDQIVTIVPAAGKKISKVIVDGVDKGRQQYIQFENIAANHTIEVEFATGNDYYDFAPALVDPVISFTKPNSLDIISGNYTVETLAYDADFGTTHASGVTSIMYQLFESSDLTTPVITETINTAPFYWNINTALFANGTYQIRAGVESQDFVGRKWAVQNSVTIENVQSAFINTFTYPVAAGQAFESDKYDVFVRVGNGAEQKLQVLMSDVNYHTMYDGDWMKADLKDRTFSFVHLDYDKTGPGLTFRVVKKFGVNSTRVDISPQSYGYSAILNGGKEVSFTMNDNSKYISINFEGTDNQSPTQKWIKNMLCIFVDPPEVNKPNKTDNGVLVYSPTVTPSQLSAATTIYFPAGYYNLNDYNLGGPISADGAFTLKSGQSLYLEGGAFVEGRIKRTAYGDVNQKIYGRGILTGRQYYWHNHPLGTIDYGQLIELGDQAEVTGIMYMESPNHGIVGRNVKITNVKFLGWHSNNDGIRVGSGSEISYTFSRAVDDHFYNFNIYVHHCVLWAGHNGSIMTYGWGGEVGSNNYGAGSSVMDEIDIINPEWTGLGNNNGLIMSQQGYNHPTLDYGTGSATTVLKNIRIEGTIPGLTNLKPRSNATGNIAVQVDNAAVTFLGDLIMENITVNAQSGKGLIRGEANPSYNGNAVWYVKDVEMKNITIGGVCVNETNKNQFFTIDEPTMQNVVFSGCGTIVPNVFPTVSINSPVNAAIFTAPATITISATATDSDGSIAKVEFYNGTTLLNSDNTSPYSYSWTNVTQGTYSVTAVAYDDKGDTTQSEAVLVTVNAEIPAVTDITDLSATVVDCNTVELVWTDVASEDGYRIRRKLSTETTYTNIGDVAADITNYTDEFAMENITYDYMVRPLQNGVAVKISNIETVTLPSCPVLNVTQILELEQGWNLISIHVKPTSVMVGGIDVASNISTIFTGLDVALIKDANGFWEKGQVDAFNSLKTITAGKGYLVYMNTAGILQITGTAVQTPNLGVSKVGWNLIGYPGCADANNCNAIPFSTYFNSINCQVIKNFDGFWSPTEPLNSIQNLEPGKGYYVFINVGGIF